MAVEEVEVYEYDTGFCVDPKSDTKEVFIPSPPTKILQKINPRPAVILFGEWDMDALKVKADEEKIVYVLPTDADDHTVENTISFVIAGAKKLNVVADEVTVGATEAALDEAQKFVDTAVDEYDADLEDAEVYAL